MRVFDKIELFNAERNLLRSYDKQNEYRMLKEELDEYMEGETTYQEVDALCDIIVVAVGGLLKQGFDPTLAMDETCKEILSRKGSIDESGKFQKDKSIVGYKADYSKAIR